MTPRQTAVAAGADLKWLRNSAALLRRRLHYTPEAARWWGLVRLLVDELGLTLKAAADAATAALRPGTAQVKRRTGSAQPVRIELDRPLYESVFLANLSRALTQETPKRRGRTREKTFDPILAALNYGIDTTLMKTSLRRTPAERLVLLDANVEFVRAARLRK